MSKPQKEEDTGQATVDAADIAVPLASLTRSSPLRAVSQPGAFAEGGPSPSNISSHSRRRHSDHDPETPTFRSSSSTARTGGTVRSSSSFPENDHDDEILVTAYLVPDNNHEPNHNNHNQHNTTISQSFTSSSSSSSSSSNHDTIPTAHVTRLLKPPNPTNQNDVEEASSSSSKHSQEQEPPQPAAHPASKRHWNSTQWSLVVALFLLVVVVVSVGVSVLVVVVLPTRTNPTTTTTSGSDTTTNTRSGPNHNDNVNDEPFDDEWWYEYTAYDRDILVADEPHDDNNDHHSMIRTTFHVVSWGVQSVGCHEPDWGSLWLICDSVHAPAAMVVLDVVVLPYNSNNNDPNEDDHDNVVVCTRETSNEIVCDWNDMDQEGAVVVEQQHEAHLLVACAAAGPEHHHGEEEEAALVLEAWIENDHDDHGEYDNEEEENDEEEWPLCDRLLEEDSRLSSFQEEEPISIARYRGDWMHWVSLSPLCVNTERPPQEEDSPGMLLWTDAHDSPGMECLDGMTRRPFPDDTNRVVCVAHSFCESTLECQTNPSLGREEEEDHEEECIGEDYCHIDPLLSVLAVEEWHDLLSMDDACILYHNQDDTKGASNEVQELLENLLWEDDPMTLRQQWLPSVLSSSSSSIGTRLQDEFIPVS